ncbi:MAG TPA: MlaD family protein [Thermodesulfobacteriota bacterium]|nr:MlaD family protein [Thermodesulfobacteriota bacterium]
MSRLSTEAKVGLFVLLVLVLFALLSVRVGGLRWLGTRGYTISVVVPSASGIDEKTAVEIAGIKVGAVEAVRLEDGRARIFMRIRDDVRIPADSQVAIRTRGLLGEKFIEIIPGRAHREEGPTSSAGRSGIGVALAGERRPPRDERFIPPGGEIQRQVPVADTEQLVQQFSAIADDLKAITGSLRGVVGTAEGQRQLREIVRNLAEVTGTLSRLVAQNDRKIATLVDNLEAFSRDLRELSAASRQDAQATVANLREFSEALRERSPALLTDLQQMAASLNELIRENRQAVGESLERIRSAAERLDQSLESVASIAQKIDRGQGTLGRLVNDEEIGENLADAVAGIRDFLGTTQRLRTTFGFRGEYQGREGDSKTAVSLELAPGPDRSYLLEIVNNPFGRQRVNTTTTTVTGPGGTTTTTTRSVSAKENELQVTFLLEKRWDYFSLRGGLIESSGGGGVGLHLFDRRLDLRLDAFNFSREWGPNLRAEARYHFFPHLFLVAGGENLLDDRDIAGPRRTWFLGGGFTFEDEDLKTLVRQAPAIR